MGRGNGCPNPWEQLIADLSGCMMVGYGALRALNGVTLEELKIPTERDTELRGFFGQNSSAPAGYRSLNYEVRPTGDGSKQQFARIHEVVMATSPNYDNIAWAAALKPALVVE